MIVRNNLPANSALHVSLGGSGWTLSDYLLASLWTAFQGTPHPALPKVAEVEDPAKLKKREEALERIHIREEKLKSGEIPMV